MLMGSFKHCTCASLIIARILAFVICESKNAYAALKYSQYMKRVAPKDRSL